MRIATGDSCLVGKEFDYQILITVSIHIMSARAARDARLSWTELQGQRVDQIWRFEEPADPHRSEWMRLSGSRASLAVTMLAARLNDRPVRA